MTGKAEAVQDETIVPSVAAGLSPFQPFSPKSEHSSVAVSSSSSARVKIRLARLQAEAQEKERRREYVFQLAVKRMEIEAEREVRLRRLELELRPRQETAPLRVTETGESSVSPHLSKPHSDITKVIAILPQFRESEVDAYFAAFERIVTSLRWPRDMWALMLQCKLSGKAQEVCTALSVEEGLNYETVKAAILRAYELVPEAYRQKFREFRKSASQSFVEFAREKTGLFEKWLAANQVTEFSSLKELILLEEFKRCVPERVKMYLNEQKVVSIATAAVMAEEFMLTHKHTFTLSDQSLRSSARKQTESVGRTQNSPVKETRECFYCHKPGHVIANCLALKAKQERIVKPRSSSINLVNTRVISSANELESVFQPFILSGSVSIPESQASGNKNST